MVLPALIAILSFIGFKATQSSFRHLVHNRQHGILSFLKPYVKLPDEQQWKIEREQEQLKQLEMNKEWNRQQQELKAQYLKEIHNAKNYKRKEEE